MADLRYLHAPVTADLAARKMVFVGGPRQVGKTTFGLSFLEPPSERHPGYLNWDELQARAALLRGELPADQPVVLLDEVHKYARWRGLLKGFYDTRKNSVSFIVTGSARLDHYRKGGDSLQGRYHSYRLHPFSLTEAASGNRAGLTELLRWGGFPEPLFGGSDRLWRRWQRERMERVLYEDLRDLEHVRELSLIELLVSHLPDCVGSPLSVGSLRTLLQVAHESVERWITILENLYVCYRIPPFGAPRIRAVKKEQKLYFWDWSQVPGAGPRFENLVASHLLKFCHFREDTEGHRMELRFLRDTDKREIDFVVLENRKPIFAVECKSGEARPNPHAAYFRTRTPIPRFYQVHTGLRDHGDADTGVRVLPLPKFCELLGLP